MLIEIVEKISQKEEKEFVRVELLEVKEKIDQVYRENGSVKMVLHVEKAKITRRKLFLLARKIINLANQNKFKNLVLDLSDFIFPLVKISAKELAEILVTNFEMAGYKFNKYKETPKEGWDKAEKVILIVKKEQQREVQTGIDRGIIIGWGVNHARDLANIPGGDMTPQLLLDEAKKLFEGSKKVKLEYLDKEQMEELGMGGVLSVAKGSDEPPYFIIAHYQGAADKKAKPLVLVGKAVTFDSGGVNIKPTEGINDMHMDMAGGAATLGALAIAEKFALDKNIIALIPAVENMPSGSSYRPGDIVKSLSGKTIEINNTDAEGRVILADALTYAERFDPEMVVDVATLTGAALVALGQRAMAVYSSSEKYHDDLKRLGEESGDYVWPMPLWEEFEEEIKGNFGDVSNLGKTKFGGSITAAAFLLQFAKKYPWIHIDMAPRMVLADDELLAKGASGAPVRLLVKIIEELSV